MNCLVTIEDQDGLAYQAMTNKYGAYSLTIPQSKIDQGQKIKVQAAPEGGSEQVEEGSSVCHDSITRLRFTTQLEAPLSATVVSPLTTLISHLQTSQGKNLLEAEAIVKYALGINTPAGDETLETLLTYDVISGLYNNQAGAASILLKTAQVMNIVNQAQTLFANQQTLTVTESIFKELVKQMSMYYDAKAGRRRVMNVGFDLTSGSFVSDLYKDTATEVGLTVTDSKALDILDTVSNTLADLNSVIMESSSAEGDGIGVLEAVSQVNIVLQTEVAGQIAKVITEEIDTQSFKASTSTQVVKNRATSVVIPVSIDSYLEESEEARKVVVNPVAPDNSKNDNDPVPIIVGAVCGGLALIGIIFVGAYHYRKKRGNQQVHLLSDGASPSNPGATSSKPASKKQKGTDVESITLEGLDDHQRKQEHKHPREVNPISLEDPM